jgi:thymidylate synthase ThyX
LTEGKITPQESYTPEERQALEPYFSNLDGPVFALTNLPEVVKGALFARYSRSAKSLRRLFLDEFLDQVMAHETGGAVGVARAEKLYEKVFVEFGDDSVAQLGGVHLACEGSSNILTKVLEWGRLMAYLEQSTRYVPYTDRPGGNWKYHIPAELEGGVLRERYVSTLDHAFGTYAHWLEKIQDYFKQLHPREAGVSAGVYGRTIRAKALDAVRGLLPAAVTANVGIYGTGQAYEALLLRMFANPLQEVRDYAGMMLTELRQVIPAFLTRVDQERRGVRWSRYISETRDDMTDLAGRMLADVSPVEAPEVELSDFDPDGELKVVAAALYSVSALPDAQLLEIARGMSVAQRAEVLRSYIGERANRRHKPGRAFERTAYRFDILGDYGAFRDLQRHRLLTLEWQTLSTDHGYDVSEAIVESGALDDWKQVMDRSAELHGELREAGYERIAPYAVSLAYNIRFYMDMNAREAMHVIELRTAPAGHAAYRRVCQQMHKLIAEKAGHPAIAESMIYTDHDCIGLERLASEQAAEIRRGQVVAKDESGRPD